MLTSTSYKGAGSEVAASGDAFKTEVQVERIVVLGLPGGPNGWQVSIPTLAWLSTTSDILTPGAAACSLQHGRLRIRRRFMYISRLRDGLTAYFPTFTGSVWLTADGWWYRWLWSGAVHLKLHRTLLAMPLWSSSPHSQLLQTGRWSSHRLRQLLNE